MPPPLVTPFGVDWDSLELAHVLAFLAQSEDESLIWEAKGGEITPHHVRQAVSGFGNSELGGVLILGVTRDRATREWVPDHWEPPEREAQLWITNCLARGGVRPRPWTGVKPWDVDGGGQIACVAVAPAAMPPILTSAGQAWERTSGATVKVTDPADLRRLFERGRAAAERAASIAVAAAKELFEIELTREAHAAVLAFAAPSVPGEMTGVVFRRTLVDIVVAHAKDLLREDTAPGLQPMIRGGGEVNQGGVTAFSTGGFADDASYSVRLRRDGGIAVGFTHRDLRSGAEWTAHAHERLARMWNAGRDLLERLGAVRELRAAGIFDGPNGPIEAGVWSLMESDGTDERGRIVRDVQRALGRPEWEPEP